MNVAHDVFLSLSFISAEFFSTLVSIIVKNSYLPSGARVVACGSTSVA